MARPESDGARRKEILLAASTQIAASGLRTSLEDIAKAAGILPGSLYHHFESKEAILIELVVCFYADLDRIGGAAQQRLDEPANAAVIEEITELGLQIADCAVQHRAALQLTFYEPPAGASQQLVELARRPRGPIGDAMLALLRAGKQKGEIRAEIDLVSAASRVCTTMLHVGLDVIRNNAPARRVAGVLLQALLYGLAKRPPSDAALDASRAMLAVNAVIDTWDESGEVDPTDKLAHVRAVARTEFGRRGYEATTIRDIAAAAKLGTGTVYRLIGSKEDLLASIMESQGRKVAAGWTAALQADATSVEKFDALTWVVINLLERFPDEFKIQLAWLRKEPPDTDTPGWLFHAWLRHLGTMLSDGIAAKELRIDSPSIAMLARCVIDLLWIPEDILRAVGKRAALSHARDAMLHGIAERRTMPKKR